VLARLDAVIETNPADPQASIAVAFAEVASVHPDLWQVLRDHAGHPALAEGSARFRRSVLAGTGVDLASLMPGGSPRDITGHTEFEAPTSSAPRPPGTRRAIASQNAWC
jgi:hypothetical protein